MTGVAPADLYTPAFDFGTEPVALIELADWFNGLAFKSIDFSSDGLPVVKIAEIKNGLSDTTKRTQATYDPKARLSNGDLLFCWSGQPETSIGTFIWSQGDAWLNQHIFRVVAKEGVDQNFLHFLMLYLQPNFQAIAGNKQTTGLGHVTKRDLGDMLIQIPEIDEQYRIVEVLQPIQERIALASRIATTLEETARALFRSWFVDFDPVHAKAEGGDPGLPAEIAALFPDRFDDNGLPEGWSEGSPAEFADINPTTPLERGKSAPYIDMAALPTSGPSILKLGLRPTGSGARFLNGDTLLARITPCLENGKTALVDCLPPNEAAWGSTEFIVLRPKEGTPDALPYLIARHPSFRDHMIAGMSGTSGRQRVSAEAVNRWQMAIPTDEIVTAFADAVTPVFAKITELAQFSASLAGLRDTLLPKLISGELRIPEAEEAVAAA